MRKVSIMLLLCLSVSLCSCSSKDKMLTSKGSFNSLELKLTESKEVKNIKVLLPELKYEETDSEIIGKNESIDLIIFKNNSDITKEFKGLGYSSISIESKTELSQNIKNTNIKYTETVGKLDSRYFCFYSCDKFSMICISKDLGFGFDQCRAILISIIRNIKF